MDDPGEVVTTENTAARYIGGHVIGVAPAALQAPGPGKVRTHVAYTGICGTDLHILHGDVDQRVSMPAVLGPRDVRTHRRDRTRR
jgi:(R,R)-butanediol dehydrogenase / meso-butanediol dehydrogenase / diacetyl reductase